MSTRLFPAGRIRVLRQNDGQYIKSSLSGVLQGKCRAGQNFPVHSWLVRRTFFFVCGTIYDYLELDERGEHIKTAGYSSVMKLS